MNEQTLKDEKDGFGIEVGYCDQGHPAHDLFYGCGPCADEKAAGMGPRAYAGVSR